MFDPNPTFYPTKRFPGKQEYHTLTPMPTDVARKNDMLSIVQGDNHIILNNNQIKELYEWLGDLIEEDEYEQPFVQIMY